MSLAFGSRHPCDDRLGLSEAAPLRERCPDRDRPWVLAVSILGSSLAFIEGSVVGLAMPAIQAGFDADARAVQWVSNAYLLVLGAFLLIGGAAGDRFGLRRVFVGGCATFAAGALASGLAPSLGWLVTFRIVQGLGAAALVPVSLALISRHFDKDSRGKAIGTWAGASALTTAAGPVAGGWLVDAFGWESVFLMVPPMALATTALALWRVPDDRPATTMRPDYVGGLLLAAALSLLILSLLRTGRLEPWLWVAGALTLGALFLRRQHRVPEPMVPLELFTSRVFTGANLVTLLLYWALSGALYFLPFNLIQVQGFTALEAGLALLPMTLLLGFGSTFAGDLIRRFPPRWVLSVGPLIAGAGFALMALPGVQSQYLQDWFPGIVLMSVGMTISVAPLTTVVMNAVDDARAGVASGINNSAARLAGVLAIAILTAVAVPVFAASLEQRLDAAGAPEELERLLLGQAHRLAEIDLPDDTVMPTTELRGLVESSYVQTFRVIALLCALAAFVAALAAMFLLGERSADRERPSLDSRDTPS